MNSDRKRPTGKNGVPKSRALPADPVEVFCRVRPLPNSSGPVCLRVQSESVLQLLPPEIYQKFKDCVVSEYTFRFVFGEDSLQSEVFDRVALPMVQDVLHGKNCLLFTYGVTSSGKTYTMTGNPEDSGILPRSLNVIFNSLKSRQVTKLVFKPNKQNGFQMQLTSNALLEQHKEICTKTPVSRKRNLVEWYHKTADSQTVEISRPDIVFAVFVSFVEIYNNYIYDLLEDNTFEVARGKSPQSKILREDHNRNMFVGDTTEVEVKSAEDAFEVFWRGQQRRKIAHTALNTESSRSHSVFVIRVIQAVWDNVSNDVNMSVAPVISQLSLVDLAGSERTGRTRNVGVRLKEAGNINNSLMVLRQCIEVLREKQLSSGAAANKMVPYRDNKLTQLFKSFFEGEGKVRMIVCVNPGIDEFEETIQAMKFAELAQEVYIPRQIQRPPVAPKVIRMAKTDSEPVFTLSPVFPDLVMNCPDDSQPLKTLEEFLLSRMNCKSQALQANAQKQSDFREQLDKFQTVYNIMKQKFRSCQTDLSHRVEELANAERRLRTAEQSVDTLQRKLSELEKVKRIMQIRLREKEARISTNKVNQIRMEADLKDKLDVERDRMRRMMQLRLAAKEAELQAKMCLSEEKLRMLRDILNSGDDWVLEDAGLYRQFPTFASDPQLNILAGSHNVISRSDPKLTEPKTPGRSGIPAVNPRHRRSVSDGGSI